MNAVAVIDANLALARVAGVANGLDEMADRLTDGEGGSITALLAETYVLCAAAIRAALSDAA